MSLSKLIVITIIGLVTALGSVNVTAAPKKIHRLFFLGDSLSDDGGDNSTWYLLKVLNGKMGDEGVDYIQPWVRGWLSERIPDYGEICSISIVPCRTVEKEALKGIIDILKDSGEVPILPPDFYYKGHWSNGPVWPEYLAPMMGISTSDKTHYINASHGGSWSLCVGDKTLGFDDLTGNLETVAEDMVNGSLIPPCLKLIAKGINYKYGNYQPDDMVIIFFGANDYLNLYQDPKRVVEAQSEIVEDAISKGAKNIAWLTVPDIAKTPRFLNGPIDKAAKVYKLISTHNSLLKEAFDRLNNKYSSQNVNLLFVDAKKVFDDLLKNANNYGFSVVDHPCSTYPVPGLDDGQLINKGSGFGASDMSASNGSICKNEGEYMFWDSVHPTTLTHKIIAQKACDILKQAGYQCNR